MRVAAIVVPLLYNCCVLGGCIWNLKDVFGGTAAAAAAAAVTHRLYAMWSEVAAKTNTIVPRSNR